MRKIICNLLMVIVFVSCFQIFSGQAVATPSPPLIFQDEGPFVESYAIIGCIVIGIPLAIVGATPAAIVGFIIGLPLQQPLPGAGAGVLYYVMGALVAGQFIVALPALILKKIFYDAPKTLKDKLRKNSLKAPSAYGHESRK